VEYCLKDQPEGKGKDGERITEGGILVHGSFEYEKKCQRVGEVLEVLGDDNRGGLRRSMKGKKEGGGGEKFFLPEARRDELDYIVVQSGGGGGKMFGPLCSRGSKLVTQYSRKGFQMLQGGKGGERNNRPLKITGGGEAVILPI